MPSEPEDIQLSFMSWCAPKKSLEWIVEAAREHGYDAIEPFIGPGADHAHGLTIDSAPETLARARTMIGEAGLRVSAIAPALQFAGGGAGARESLKELKKSLGVAAELEAPCVRILAGPLPEGLEFAGVVDGMCELLDAAGDAAAEAGVMLVLSTHDSFIHSKFVREVIKSTCHDALKAAWEVGATMRALETVGEAYDNLSEYLRYVYVQDIRYKDDMTGFEPTLLGEGIVPVKQAVRFLVRDGYSGTISAKTSGDLGDVPEQTLPVYARVLREYIAEAIAAEGGGPAAEQK